jgi:FkbM family methyltransferase
MKLKRPATMSTPSFRFKLLRFLGHQDWIRYGIREKIIRRFCNPDTIPDHEFEIDFFGLRYSGNLSGYIDWVVFFYGAYEKYELFLLRDLVKDRPKPVFLDIGANVGQHSLFMSPYCDQIHAFEPYELVKKQFDRKIQLNNIRNINLHQVGLGHIEASLDYFAPSGGNTGTGSFVPSGSREGNELVGKLPIVHADAYLSRLNLEKIDLIKIDVEGFEENILSGLKSTLHKHRPTVMMEFSTQTRNSFSHPQELMSLLPEGYRIQLIQTYKPYFGFFCKPEYSYADFDFNISTGNLLLTPKTSAS